MTGKTLLREADCQQRPEQGRGRTTRARILRLLRSEIHFVPNPGFCVATEPDEELVDEVVSRQQNMRGAPAGLPPHLQRLCEFDLLSPEQEAALFRQMNYLKFRANVLRSRMDPERSSLSMVITVESLLRKAELLRDHIIGANMRLVMSIAKRYVTPQQSFDELLSEGIATLMQAVEKFDFSRGFRFSTYAYRAIARDAYRCVTSARRDRSRFHGDAGSEALELEDHRGSIARDEAWNRLRELAGSLLENLDRREQFIVRARYALGSHRKVRTFQELADRLGISKERVRQLEQRAVSKLQQMAAELDLDKLISPAVV